MESSEFISVEEILSELITLANDEGYARSGLDRGFYLTRIHRAVTYFALETYYQTVTKDIINFDRTGDGVLEIPINCFNVKEIYLFNGESKCLIHEEGCVCSNKNNIDSGDYVLLHWKRTLTTGKSGLKTMRIRHSNNDTVLSGTDNYFAPNKDFTSTRNNLFYFNTQSGKIILSDNYDCYKNIRIVYYGMGSPNGELPCIPRIIQDGIMDKAALETFTYLKTRDRAYQTDYNDAYARLNGNNRHKGSLKECKQRIAAMDYFKKQSIKEYLSNADFL